MPAWFMKFPDRMNSGTARRAKFCVWETASWMGIVNGNSGYWRKKSVPAIPMAKATGIPSRIRTTKAHDTSSINPTSQSGRPLDGSRFGISVAPQSP